MISSNDIFLKNFMTVPDFPVMFNKWMKIWN